MEQISIAKVIKPQGLKGELKCLPLIKNEEIFNDLKTIFCDGKEINIISSVFRLGFVYIMLENVLSIDQAEYYRNKTFYINKKDFELEENSFFINDLIGLSVYDEHDQHIGEILDVENYGATDILQIKDGWATYLVPFIKKIFLAVDIDNKKVVVCKAKYEENKV